jgi:hypothetical protein
LPLVEHGAQRASLRKPYRLTVMGLVMALVTFTGFAADPSPAAAAASLKVVVVVGPAGSSTAKYITSAKRYASQAREYGADVVEIYSPNATWSKVKSATQGANILIYLGHGNGHPSPYGPFSALTKDGMGLNKSAGNGHNNVKYYGEYYVKTYINLAANAVVILNRLCYASGNSEWGAANPPKAVAMKRADNFAAGFLRTGAKAVFAEGIDSISYVLSGLFESTRTVSEIFTSAGSWTGARDFKFKSVRSPSYTVWMDPYAPSRYYRSVVGTLTLTAETFRAG